MFMRGMARLGEAWLGRAWQGKGLYSQNKKTNQR